MFLQGLSPQTPLSSRSSEETPSSPQEGFVVDADGLREYRPSTDGLPPNQLYRCVTPQYSLGSGAVS